ncbi:hypothetical protein HJG60_009293 [Phyllostomus discolor]|uniref:Uncharacterized protein n=1 Tax=Phyllostomus discolor TaxID=89673 RepID=A0A834DCD1_9CHIR|nr:hypothetical protein HJG60_009293 [Phyllostomus discolor]
MGYLIIEGIRHGGTILVDIRSCMKERKRVCECCRMSGSEGFEKPGGYQERKDFLSHFVFFSLPDPSRIWHSVGVSEDIRFLCIKPIRPVTNSGFVKQDFDWNVTPEGGMYGFWSSPESPEELGLTCKASVSP